jgi:hypothetical protein
LVVEFFTVPVSVWAETREVRRRMAAHVARTNARAE